MELEAKQHRVDTETRDSGSSTNSTASLVPLCDRHEFGRRQNEMGQLGMYVQSVRKCGQHSHGRLDGTRAECDRPVGLAHSAR